MKTLAVVLLIAAFASAQSGNTIYVSGNNAAAVEARKDIVKACPNFTPVDTQASAAYLLEVSLDSNGAANGTLTKGGKMLWSDSYDSNFYHHSDRGKLNAKLLINKLRATYCRAEKAAK